MWRDGKYPAFKCPLCGSGKYVEVRVQKSNGHWYTTEFYQCFHCSVMFRDPVQFTRQKSTRDTDRITPGGAYSMINPRPTPDDKPI